MNSRAETHPTESQIALDAFLDHLVQQPPASPRLLITPPDPLTAFASRLILADQQARPPASATDPMLAQLLQRQAADQSPKTPPVRLLKSSAPATFRPLAVIPHTSRIGLLARLAALVTIALAAALITIEFAHIQRSAAPIGSVPEVEWQMPITVSAYGVVTSVNIAPDGTIWAPQAREGIINVISADGVLLEQWGKPGSGPGEFRFIEDTSTNLSGLRGSGVAWGPDGTIYVADQGNNRIQMFSTDRSYIGQFDEINPITGLPAQPVGIVVDSAGQVYVSDRGNVGIQIFSPEGTYLRSIGVPVPGEETTAISGYFTIDGNGDLWLPDCARNQITQMDSEGNVLSVIGSTAGSLNCPIAVALDASNRLIIADHVNNRIVLMSTDGAFLAAWKTIAGEPITLPVAIATLPDGAIILLDNNQTRISSLIPTQ